MVGIGQRHVEERHERIVEVLKQSQYEPMEVARQVLIIFAATAVGLRSNLLVRPVRLELTSFGLKGRCSATIELRTRSWWWQTGFAADLPARGIRAKAGLPGTAVWLERPDSNRHATH